MTSTKTKGFTIVELLTVMSIIIILMSVLVPGLARTRRYAKVVTQKAQFHEISKGLELFRNDHQETYPDSGAVDTDPAGPYGYCGAMKLCEALVGQDGMGNHPSSSFQAQQPNTYLFDLCTIRDPGVTAYDVCEMASLRERTKYVEADSVKAYRLQDIYTWDITTGVSFYTPTRTFTNADMSDGDPTPNAVIGDVFQKADIKGTSGRCPARAGQKVGMPVLYYKADSSKIAHDATTIPAAGTPNTNLYNFDDNYAITMLGCPWETSAPPTGSPHPMQTNPRIFLKAITNDKVTATPRPHNEDGYILLSAGWDGLYGTQDDVYNFAK